MSINLIPCTVDSLSVLAKDNMKDPFQPFLCKLENNIPAGSSLLFADDLGGRINKLNNTISLMKPSKMISKKPSSRPEKALLTGKKDKLVRATHSPMATQLGKIDSRSKANTKNTDWLRRSLSCLWFVTKMQMFHSWKHL